LAKRHFETFYRAQLVLQKEFHTNTIMTMSPKKRQQQRKEKEQNVLRQQQRKEKEQNNSLPVEGYVDKIVTTLIFAAVIATMTREWCLTYAKKLAGCSDEDDEDDPVCHGQESLSVEQGVKLATLLVKFQHDIEFVKEVMGKLYTWNVYALITGCNTPERAAIVLSLMSNDSRWNAIYRITVHRDGKNEFFTDKELKSIFSQLPLTYGFVNEFESLLETTKAYELAGVSYMSELETVVLPLFPEGFLEMQQHLGLRQSPVPWSPAVCSL
jgi:hypothetical protein